MSYLTLGFRGPLLVWVAVTAALTNCSGLRQAREERSIAPKANAGDYTFRTWPGSKTTYRLTLSNVVDTSAHLGPDFTVHYFTFTPTASLALYNGGHPMTRAEKPVSTFRAPVGTSPAKWTVTKRDSDYRAETYVAQDDHNVWHATVVAPTQERLHEIVAQLASLRVD